MSESNEQAVRLRLRLPQRGQSTIQFPYKDLEASIAVAKAIRDSGAISGMAADQLAAALAINSGTGNFLTRTSSARMFGLISSTTGRYQLTDLGERILSKDDREQRAARVRAFLSVPLYEKVYSTYRGRTLPPRPTALENAFVELGVAPKQGGNARLPFEKSAKLAGFFDSGEDRLIEPIIAPAPNQRSASATLDAVLVKATGEVPHSPSEPKIAEAVGVTSRSARLHPFIQGLLESLPPPGALWPEERRAKWLQAATHCFDLMYKARDETTSSAPQIDVPSEAPPVGGGVPRRRPSPLSPEDREMDISGSYSGRDTKPS